MNLVVDVGVADERVALGAVVAQLQHGNGVARGVGVGDRGPLAVVVVRCTGQPLEVSAEVVETIGLDGVCGIHAHCVAHGTAGVTVAVLGVHELGVEVHGQVVVKQRRVEVDSSRVALEARGLEDTLLVGVTHRHAIRQVAAHRAGHHHVVVVADGFAEDFVLPVGVVFAQCLQGFGLAGVALVEVFHESSILIAVHHVDGFLLHAQRHATVVRHAGLLAAAAFLGGDDDDTVRTAATVDGRCRSVFQHVEALDILRVDNTQSVRHTLDTRLVHGHTVDDDKGVVAGVQ